MIAALKRLAIRALRVPPEPHDPEGAPGSLVVLRPGAGYFRARLYLWLAMRVLIAIWTLMGAGFVFVMLVVVRAALDAKIGARGRHNPFTDLPRDVVTSIAIGCLAVAAIVWLAHTLFSYATMRLDFEMRWYKVTDRSLRIREGVWFVREMTMSFANIQNLSITQGPLQKLCGVSDLRVESAGGGGAQGQPGVVDLHVGWFRGVERAEEIKELMLKRLREHGRLTDGGLGDHEDAPKHVAAPARTARAIGPAAMTALREVRAEAGRLRAAASHEPAA